MENEENKSFRSFISTKDAAERLGYTVQHTRLLIRKGEIDAAKFGRDWMVVRESIAEYNANRRNDDDDTTNS